MVASSKCPAPPASSCDGQPLSALASKIPKIKRTGDLRVDTQKTIERDAFVRIVDKLSKYPKYILPMHGIMMSQDFNAETMATAAPTKSEWTGNYGCLGKIPKEWICQWLLHRSEKLGASLTAAHLAKIEEDSPENIKMLFSLETQTLPHQNFPSTCHDAYIATKTFNERASQVGNRLAKFMSAGGIRDDGSLDFSKGGCYKLQFEGDRCSTIVHISGTKATLPAHVVITKDFVLYDNHLDHLAKAELLPSTYTLIELFPKGCDLDKLAMRKKDAKPLKEMATAIADAHAEGQRSKIAETVQVAREDSSVLKVVANRKAAANLIKARTKLLEKAEERKTRRTIKLG